RQVQLVKISCVPREIVSLKLRPIRFTPQATQARPLLHDCRQLLLIATALGCAAPAYAIDPVDSPDYDSGPYAGLSAGLLFVDAGGEKFSPAVLQADFGYRINELLTTELSAGVGVHDDDS